MKRSLDELVEQANAGDPLARRDLLDVYREHLRRMISVRLDSRTASRVDPSDVVQDTLLEASRRLDAYLAERPIPFLAWLRQIAGERLIDTHRRHVQSQRRSVLRECSAVDSIDGSSEALARAMVTETSSPSHKMLRRERLEQVQRALQALPAGDREILVMRHLEHLRIEAIAELLGITPGAAKARILRALLRMRDLLGTEP